MSATPLHRPKTVRRQAIICIKNFIFQRDTGKKENSEVQCLLANPEARKSGEQNTLQIKSSPEKGVGVCGVFLLVFFCFLSFLSLASEIVLSRGVMNGQGRKALRWLEKELFSSKGLQRIMGFLGSYFVFLSLCV